VTLVYFYICRLLTRWPQVISQGCVLTYEIWWIYELLKSLLLNRCPHDTEERKRERAQGKPAWHWQYMVGRGWFCVIDPNNITKNRVSSFTMHKKIIKSAKWITVQCALYSVHRNRMEWLCGISPTAYQIASTPYHECTRSHYFTRSYQLRTIMNAVAPTPYQTQFVDSVKSLSFGLTRAFFGPTAYMVRNWCDRVQSWYGVDAIW
jgi:hypothetical protein